MSETPGKLSERNLNTSLTPVRFIDNKRLKSPGTQTVDSNLAACKSRLETLVQNLQSNYDKWQQAQQRGTTLCYAIEARKTRCLEKASNSSEGDSYPEELKGFCDKLSTITSIFADIVKNTRETLRQMRSLSKLCGSATDTVFYRTWRVKQFVDFVEELLERYVKESTVKERVMQNIAHCTERAELITYTTVWEYPEYVDGFAALGFLLLTEEVKK